jgi:thioredoxin-related protein
MQKTLIIAILGIATMIGLSFMIAEEEKIDHAEIARSVQAKKKNPAMKRQNKSHPAGISGKKPSSNAVNRKMKKSHKGPKPGETVKAGNLEWMHIEDAGKMKNKAKKKYLVDVYTDWCGWCKVMDDKTFSDPEVQKYLNENFHVVKFDAEQRDPIAFKGKSYDWVPSGRKGVNKLAVELLGSRLSYPTMVYLDENLNKIRVSPGYKKPDQLLAELKQL